VSHAALRARVRAMLDDHWVPEGYAAPHAMVYPWQWLWDSCFHALIWAELGEPARAVRELTSALSVQTADGFVPHMNYVRDPMFHADFWGRQGASNITQPPMYGHAIAELGRRGITVPADLVERAERGLRFLLDVRPRHAPSGLVPLAHPWESGCDDSPRWDDVCPGNSFDWATWKAYKGDLVAAVEVGPDGGALGNRLMTVVSVGFNALVAFNARELAAHTGDARLAADADLLATSIDARWDPALGTWIDGGQTETGSGRARTLDALLPVLVTQRADARRAAFAALVDPDAFGGPFGPAGVHRAEPTFAPDTYWRGPAWPQLSYLLWVAARAADDVSLHDQLRDSTVAAADRSSLAEYWNPDTAAGLGAIPQSWTGLALVMAAR
jgi:hypothetical protein